MYVHTPSSLEFDLVALKVRLVLDHLDKRLEKERNSQEMYNFYYHMVEFHRSIMGYTPHFRQTIDSRRRQTYNSSVIKSCEQIK